MKNPLVQVDPSHYAFTQYMSQARWSSLWHQVDEILRLKPKKVLEVGPGLGYLRAIVEKSGVQVTTLDLDLDLGPSCVGSTTEIPFCENSFDVVCAFQVLEHLPYADSIRAFSELARVSSEFILISLPDAKRLWRYRMFLPFLGDIDFFLQRPFFFPRPHRFDGEHYWEVNKRGYECEKVLSDLCEFSKLIKTFRVTNNPRHRFFLFEVENS